MTNEQRRKFFAMVGDVARQVPLVINGEPTMAHKDDWKLVFTAGLINERRIADGLDGQKVALGLRLRDIFKGLDEAAQIALAGDLITVVQMFGDRNKVLWTDPEEAAAMAAYEAHP